MIQPRRDGTGVPSVDGPSSSDNAGTGDAGTGTYPGSVVDTPVTAPITACGNGLLGSSECTDATTTARVHSRRGGVLSAPVTAPITVCGNGSGTCAITTGTTPGDPGNPGTPSDPGDPGTPSNPGTPVNPGGPAPVGPSLPRVSIELTTGLTGPDSSTDVAAGNLAGGAGEGSVAAESANAASGVLGSINPGALAYTGSPVELAGMLAVILLMFGSALCFGWRRRPVR